MAATILTALALLGTAAGAANRGADLTTLDPEGIAATVSANVATTMANEHSNVAENQGVEANDNDETEADEDDDSATISPSTQPNDSGTTSAKPGWGCGDMNHEHSGPPGRPGATPPPGCSQSGNSDHSNGSNGNSGTQGVSADHRNANPGASQGQGKGKGK
jgi:hypothetical protein